MARPPARLCIALAGVAVGMGATVPVAEAAALVLLRLSDGQLRTIKRQAAEGTIENRELAAGAGAAVTG